MNKEIFRPTISKILVSWLVMSFMLAVLIIMLNWKDITDLIIVAIVSTYVMFACFVFCIVFYKLPYFKIEIDDTHLNGPRGFGGGWQRLELPLEDIDLKNINASLRWLGFYLIKSKTGERLSVWGFDEKQFDKLLTSIDQRRSKASN